MTDQPIAWVVTYTMKQSGAQASAYLTEDEARRAAKNVETYAHASNVEVQPAFPRIALTGTPAQAASVSAAALTERLIQAAVDYELGRIGRPALSAARAAVETALAAQPPAAPVETEEDWRDDPGADERWNAGLDFGMMRFCEALGVDPKSVSWDAATETLDGDVSAVIGNILRAKFGEDFDRDSVSPCSADTEHDVPEWQRPACGCTDQCRHLPGCEYKQSFVTDWEDVERRTNESCPNCLNAQWACSCSDPDVDEQRFPR